MPAKKYDDKYHDKAKKLAAARKLVKENVAKKKMGPPFKEVNAREVEELASMDYTADEIAACMGIDKQTIYSREDLLGALRIGRDKGNASVRRKLHQLVIDDGIPSVSIFLGKARLGYNDGGNLGTQVQQPFAQGQL